MNADDELAVTLAAAVVPIIVQVLRRKKKKKKLVTEIMDTKMVTTNFINYH